MRAFFVAIVVIAVGYLGWTFLGPMRTATPPPRAENEASPLPGSPPTHPPASVLGSGPPSFQPGVFYALDRVTVETPTGVKALHPGEEVRLMYRYKDRLMRVTDGQNEFVLKPSSVTNDRTQALRLAPR